MAGDDADDIPDSLLRPALEFAVGIAAVGQRLRPPLPFPPELRPFLKLNRLPGKALAEVRRVVEVDDVYRTRLGAGAMPDLVGEAGMLWLQRPEGWVASLRALRESAEDDDVAVKLKRAEKRREAAEEALKRALAEVIALRADAEQRRVEAVTQGAQLAKLDAEIVGLRTEAATRTREAAKLRKRADAAEARIGELHAELDGIRTQVEEAHRIRDEVLGARASQETSFAGAVAASDRTSSRPARPATSRSARRVPIGLPGGVFGTSLEAAQ
ncbi:MAG: hypothetical protein ACOYL9_13825, partial [Ilumatobacteraceae bacterium]